MGNICIISGLDGSKKITFIIQNQRQRVWRGPALHAECHSSTFGDRISTCFIWPLVSGGALRSNLLNVTDWGDTRGVKVSCTTRWGYQIKRWIITSAEGKASITMNIPWGFQGPVETRNNLVNPYLSNKKTFISLERRPCSQPLVPPWFYPENFYKLVL